MGTLEKASLENRSAKLDDRKRRMLRYYGAVKEKGPGGLRRRLATQFLSMSRIDPVSPASFENGMAGDQWALIQDADPIGKLVNLNNQSGANGNDVIVAADRDETVMADAALLEQRVEGNCRKGLKFQLLLPQRPRS
ncbi:hypothetical protein BPNPMPFG_007761 (plasmid) [Mesorhizobium sp. AR07]|nr:hypothetical protein BPNPMPFG_007761 [Mesorhizobium sp. AR07]